MRKKGYFVLPKLHSVSSRVAPWTQSAMVGRPVIRRPGENAWSKRVRRPGCFGATVEMRMPSSGEGGRFDMRCTTAQPVGKPIKSDLTKALSGRSISVSGPTGRRRPRREWANTGNHPQLSNHTTPFYLMRRERVASATSYRQSSLSACFLRSWKRRRVPQ